jgi:hypothetical protein
MIIGRRKIRIKKYDDNHIKCEKCGNYGQRFSVYQEYFHIMFIPAFPSGLKIIKCICLKCKDNFNQEKKNFYLNQTKTPLYLYTLIIIFAGFFVSAVIAGQISRHHTKEYINSPKMGDVYHMRKTENNTPLTYFLKIKNINADTIEMIHSALQYSGSISSMNDSDYFVKEDLLKLLKVDLQSYYDSGIVTIIERNYSESSKFRNEK